MVGLSCSCDEVGGLLGTWTAGLGVGWTCSGFGNDLVLLIVCDF